MSEQPLRRRKPMHINSDLAKAPLLGKRIVVTRAHEQADVFCARLRSLGAVPVEFPLIRIEPPTDWSQLDAALHRLYASHSSSSPVDEEQLASGYDWLVLTSVNGVRVCMQRVQSLGYVPSTLQARIATIGPATAEALHAYGLHADLVPDTYVAEEVVSALLEDAQKRSFPVEKQRFLLARAAEARKVLPMELREVGASVDEVVAYTTHPVARDDAQGQKILQLLRSKDLDWLTFASSSTVRNFVSWLKNNAASEEALTALIQLVNQNTRLASIGPITSQTARELGLSVTIEAREFTIDGLIDALVKYEERH